MGYQKPLVKWTIGPSTKAGYECLIISINSFLKHHEADVRIYHNCPASHLPNDIRKFELIDQEKYLKTKPAPMGVAWKLYPSRMDINRHEISIDNDIVFNEEIEQINEFLNSNTTLLLEDKGRTYGRFEKHVPPGFKINSGIYGMPPGFDLEPFIKFYSGDQWEKNALYEHDKNETFDEQGIIALALLSHKRYIIIPNNIITDCEHVLNQGKAHHFIGLNRKKFHEPFILYKNLNKKTHL